MKPALRSIAQAFPAETRFLTSEAACQITAITLHISEMANAPDMIADDDLRQTFLHTIALRAAALSGAIGLLSNGEKFEDPASELNRVCREVEGVYPSHLSLPEPCRQAFGIPETSPIGGPS